MPVNHFQYLALVTNPVNNPCISRWRSGSPSKFNHLFIGPLPTFPENFMQIRWEVFFRNLADKQTDKQRRKHNLLGGSTKMMMMMMLMLMRWWCVRRLSGEAGDRGQLDGYSVRRRSGEGHRGTGSHVLRRLTRTARRPRSSRRRSVKAKFHYASSFEAGSKLFADLQRAEIWPII